MYSEIKGGFRDGRKNGEKIHARVTQSSKRTLEGQGVCRDGSSSLGVRAKVGGAQGLEPEQQGPHLQGLPEQDASAGSLCAPGPAGIHKYVIKEMTVFPKSGPHQL